MEWYILNTKLGKLLRYNNAYVCSKSERPKEFLQVKIFFGANNLHWAETSNFSLVLNNGADDYRWDKKETKYIHKFWFEKNNTCNYMGQEFSTIINDTDFFLFVSVFWYANLGANISILRQQFFNCFFFGPDFLLGMAWQRQPKQLPWSKLPIKMDLFRTFQLKSTYFQKYSEIN